MAVCVLNPSLCPSVQHQSNGPHEPRGVGRQASAQQWLAPHQALSPKAVLSNGEMEEILAETLLLAGRHGGCYHAA
ncbi:hypothetical protein BDFG_01852 [Blastomyces dermatitidis ATCC 26199]|nr:hypothetical protein BDFG_01852 [Blastomyces dermatitidis ATCC 26199]